MEILDTWNVPQIRNNVPDITMDIISFSSSVEDGSIKCRYRAVVRGGGGVTRRPIANMRYNHDSTILIRPPPPPRT